MTWNPCYRVPLQNGVKGVALVQMVFSIAISLFLLCLLNVTTELDKVKYDYTYNAYDYSPVGYDETGKNTMNPVLRNTLAIFFLGAMLSLVLAGVLWNGQKKKDETKLWTWVISDTILFLARAVFFIIILSKSKLHTFVSVAFVFLAILEVYMILVVVAFIMECRSSVQKGGEEVEMSPK